MSKLLLLLFLFVTAESLSQPGDSLKKDQVKQELINGDSILVKPGKFKDSLLITLPSADSMQVKEDIDRNVTGILELQRSQQAREKRNAFIRIGIGIALFIILIIGLRRKTTKK